MTGLVEILLVRHGEAAAGWGESSDPGLSELGQRQAELAAQGIWPMLGPDTQLVSSPLQRARQTAQPLAGLMHSAVHEDATFREIPSPVPLAQRQTWLRQFMQQTWDEQSQDLLAWRAAILQGLLAFERTSVVFTHFLVINAIVGQALGRAETLCCWPANGSVTRFRSNGTRLELLALGLEMDSRIN